MTPLIKTAAKLVAQKTVGRLPAPASRLNAQLAIHGGTPVRNVHLRPFAGARGGDVMEWLISVGPAMGRIFLSGSEGLPQRVAREFEKRWAEYCECRYAILLSHGTDALRIALAAALDHDGLEYGGEVIVPNLSFIASATSCLDRRFGVALVDVDPDTMMLDPQRVEYAIIPGRTKAIMPVHQFGHPADMTALLAVAKRFGLKVIEDAAQAHGAEWETGKVGGLGDAGAFSFQSSKTLACGEGGALTTNDDQLFQRALSIYNAGRAPNGGGRWEHPNLGWNCRPSEYLAELLLFRLSRFEKQQRKRSENFEMLAGLLSSGFAFEPLKRHSGVRRHGMYMFVMRYHPEHCGGAAIELILGALRAEGVPVHRLYSSTIAGQPVMQKIAKRRTQYVRVLPTPVADKAVRELAYIPHMTFLGNARDMLDITAAISKVQHHFASGGTA